MIDTNVISEARKGRKANLGVLQFFRETLRQPVFLSVITLGELQRGVSLINYRGDHAQALRLERWLKTVIARFTDQILDFDRDCAQIWARLCVPHAENPLDKQIAATALLHDLIVVTRNDKHFSGTGVRLLNPWLKQVSSDKRSRKYAKPD